MLSRVRRRGYPALILARSHPRRCASGTKRNGAPIRAARCPGRPSASARRELKVVDPDVVVPALVVHMELNTRERARIDRGDFGRTPALLLAHLGPGHHEVLPLVREGEVDAKVVEALAADTAGWIGI